jgi:tyrosyl-tRNA synthetase
MFGKLMSTSDDLMWRYYLLLTDLSTTKIDERRAQVTKGALHPKQAKIDLATRLVADFHGAAAADRAAAEFEARFTRKEFGDDVPVIRRPAGEMPAAKLLVALELAESTSDATRKIQQGALTVDGAKVTDPKWRFELVKGGLRLVKVGRRAVRVAGAEP